MPELSNRVDALETRLQRWEQLASQMHKLVTTLEGMATSVQSRIATPQTLENVGGESNSVKVALRSAGSNAEAGLQHAEFKTLLRRVQVAERHHSESLTRIIKCEKHIEGWDQLFVDLRKFVASWEKSASTIQSRAASSMARSGHRDKVDVVKTSSRGEASHGERSSQEVQPNQVWEELSSTLKYIRKTVQGGLFEGCRQDRTANPVEDKAITVVEQLPHPSPVQDKAIMLSGQFSHQSTAPAPLQGVTLASQENVDRDLRELNGRVNECERDVKRAHAALYQLEAKGNDFRNQVRAQMRGYMLAQGQPDSPPPTPPGSENGDEVDSLVCAQS